MSRLVFIVFILVSGAAVWMTFQAKLDGGAPAPTSSATISIVNPTQKTSPKFILQDVPFVIQAPTGNWRDPRQEDGCEEAASYMAVLWAREEKPPADFAEQEKKLLEISDWEEQKYGSALDTSAADTADRIIKRYFGYPMVHVQNSVTKADIIGEIEQGNLIIVPANGQKLGNPYFRQPGPERHMLLIRGYDAKTDEFITNDNGTKRGEKYRYKTGVIFNAIRDYPTGSRVPITGSQKSMIVVGR